MPIQMNYTFYGGEDESDALAFNRMMIEALQKLVSEGVVVTPRPPVPSADGENHWDAGADIYFADGSSSPTEESGEAQRIADAVGSPWEKYDGGRTRVHLQGTGGFSSNFHLMRWAELRLGPLEGANIGLNRAQTGAGYKFFLFFCRCKRNLHLLARFSFISAGIIGMIAGILVVTGQSLWWLLGNEWPELPLFLPFAFLIPMDGSVYKWLSGSGSWYGLNEFALWMLNHIPFSLFLFLIALFMTKFPRPRRYM